MKIQKPLRGKPALYKRRKSMEILGCSLSTIKKLEEAGKLEKVRFAYSRCLSSWPAGRRARRRRGRRRGQVMRRYRSQTSSPRDGDPVSPPPGETTVGLADIHVRPERLRALQPGVVDQLAESIRERGLTHPIVVRPRAAGEYWLVCGLHRLKAAEKNGDAAILCKVLPDDISDDEAELIEIDENLVRADLSPAERARHVGRRKELYEKQHPETKQGEAPGAGRGGGKKRIRNLETRFFRRPTPPPRPARAAAPLRATLHAARGGRSGSTR